MSAPAAANATWRTTLALVFSLLLPLPWLAAYHLGAFGHGLETAFAAGVSIIGAAFLLSFATELAEQDIPQAFALLVLALVSVLPEYAVDLSFAIEAATDPQYAHYAVANMTGANRLLIGIGWGAVVLVACARTGAHALEIPAHHHLEMRFLLLSTLYSFVIPLNGELDLTDAAVLLVIFFWYAAAASRGHMEEVELVGPAALIASRFRHRGRRICVLVLFALAGYAIWVSAEPFAKSLVHVGRSYQIDEFLLVQWVAPLASESPEFVIALLFAWKLRGGVGLGALISSKVNQWTLLVGALPIAYCIAAGGWSGLPLDSRQTEELFLTSAQSLLATLIIADLDFSRLEAVMIAALFGVQLFFPSPEVRLAFACLYLAIFVLLFALSKPRRDGFLALFRARR